MPIITSGSQGTTTISGSGIEVSGSVVPPAIFSAALLLLRALYLLPEA